MIDSIKYISCLKGFHQSLNEIGIFSTSDLLENSTTVEKREALKNKISIDGAILLKAIAISDLSRIKGIGIKSAESLVTVFNLLSIIDLQRIIRDGGILRNPVINSLKIKHKLQDFDSQITNLHKIVNFQPADFQNARAIMNRDNMSIYLERKILQKKHSKLYAFLIFTTVVIILFLLYLPRLFNTLHSDILLKEQYNIGGLLYTIPVLGAIFQMLILTALVAILIRVIFHYPIIYANYLSVNLSNLLFSTNEYAYHHNRISHKKYFESFKLTVRKIILPLFAVLVFSFIVIFFKNPDKFLTNVLRIIYAFLTVFVIIFTIIQIRDFNINKQISLSFYRRYFLKNFCSNIMTFFFPTSLLLLFSIFLWLFVFKYQEKIGVTTARVYNNYAERQMLKTNLNTDVSNTLRNVLSQYYTSLTTAYDFREPLREVVEDKEIKTFIRSLLIFLFIYFVFSNSIEYLIILGKRSYLIFVFSVILSIVIGQLGNSPFDFSDFFSLRTLMIFLFSIMTTLVIDAIRDLLDKKSRCPNCNSFLDEAYEYCRVCGSYILKEGRDK
jgi:hypothetical protein